MRILRRKSTPKKDFRGLCRGFVAENPFGTHGPEIVSLLAVAGGLGGERTGLLGGARLAGAGTRLQGAWPSPTRSRQIEYGGGTAGGPESAAPEQYGQGYALQAHGPVKIRSSTCKSVYIRSYLFISVYIGL